VFWRNVKRDFHGANAPSVGRRKREHLGITSSINVSLKHVAPSRLDRPVIPNRSYRLPCTPGSVHAEPISKPNSVPSARRSDFVLLPSEKVNVTERITTDDVGSEVNARNDCGGFKVGRVKKLVENNASATVVAEPPLYYYRRVYVRNMKVKTRNCVFVSSNKQTVSNGTTGLRNAGVVSARAGVGDRKPLTAGGIFR